ncbi:MAG: glycoside hydrolase family 43 protein [Ignavibacteriaceae bacterium]
MIRIMSFAVLLIFLLSVSFNSGKVYGQDEEVFTNPILAGFYPDPSICRVGAGYYLVNSTFSYYPGIPVFYSEDLVHWKHISDVMNRPEQLNLDSLGVSRGIFAPAIRYYKGTFYVTCTLVDRGGNFVVTSKSPGGPWSDPVWIPQINGIDPSLFFDTSGTEDKAYIIYNSIAPDNKPLYPGHRTIRIYEFNTDSLKVTGNEHILINGGTDISRKPVWIEGPHIFTKDGFYYLIAAEGGTAEDHSEVVFRSKNVFGPYISYENNPVLTQRNLNPDREYPVTCTGHADFVQIENGSWWAVFLGCRPYKPFNKDYYNTGRETFLAPVKWKNAWPVITSGKEKIKYYYPVPFTASADSSYTPYSGNFNLMYDFNNDQLGKDWCFLRTPHEKWYSLSEKKGYLTIRLRPETCYGNMNPSFLGHRQQHLNCSVSTALNFVPKSENEKAGLLIFQNENHFYYLCKSLENNKPVLQLYKSKTSGSSETSEVSDDMELLASKELMRNENKNELYLKIQAEGKEYSFHYSFEPGGWQVLKENVNGEFLSTKVAGGFVGCMFALYATSSGKQSVNTADYDWFKYVGDDIIYK